MRKFKLLVSISIFFWLTSCSVSTFGKFQANKGVPLFIRVGETSKKEVFDTLGEPLVHRFVAGKETVIYNHERGQYFFLYGTYEGQELVIRFENRTVSEVKIEKTGSGWGLFTLAQSCYKKKCKITKLYD